MEFNTLRYNLHTGKHKQITKWLKKEGVVTRSEVANKLGPALKDVLLTVVRYRCDSTVGSTVKHILNNFE